MTKIKVKLEAFYGYGCCGCSYDSKEVIEVEVNDEVLKALRGFGTEEISSKAIAIQTPFKPSPNFIPKIHANTTEIPHMEPIPNTVENTTSPTPH